MSTRSTVHFHSEYSSTPIIIYKHHDGYPLVEHEGEQYGMLPTLEAFFSAVEEEYGSPMGGMDRDALATMYIVWLADWQSRTDRNCLVGKYPDYEYDESKARLLRFSSVEIMASDPGDIEYRYHVRPHVQTWSDRDNPKFNRPLVTYDKRNSYGEGWKTGIDASHFFIKEQTDNEEPVPC